MKQKTFKNRSKFRNFLLFSFLLLLGGNLQAQPPLKAGFINSFVLPGQKDTINVIKKSELGSCTTAGIGINILSFSAAPGTQAHGTAVLSTDGNKNIIYTPAAGFVGQDSVRYTITCGVNTSTGLILINVTDKPDMVKDEACAVTPEAMLWVIREQTIPGYNPATQYLQNHTEILAGDLDGDGIAEIFASTGQTSPNQLNAFNLYKSDGSFIKKINTPSFGSYGGKFGIAKIKLNATDFQTIIVVGATDNYLYAYDYTGTQLWKSNAVYGRTGGGTVGIGFTDFNHDGYTEIYVNNHIFNARNGNLIVAGTGNKGTCIQYNATTSTGNITAVADITGDSNLELIAGNQVYSVDISAGTMTPVITLDLSSFTMEDGTTPKPDGNTQICDMDGDGNLDIIVQYVDLSTDRLYTYIWNPLQNKVLATKTINNIRCKGVAMLGDVDGDGKAELVFNTAYQGDSANAQPKMWAFKYDGNSILKQFWQIDTDDRSGFTGMTLFDFNQDGISEIVYRDNAYMRIINGSGKSHYTMQDTISGGNPVVYDLARFDCAASTAGEYPIVVNLNGETKIVIHRNTPGGASYSGDLLIYESDGSPWAPARPVWNQYVYNPVYVNEDLTTVQYPLNIATKFVNKDGDYLQPFNNFQQQATLLNGEGKMLSYGSDLVFDLSVPLVYSNYTGSTVDVTFNIENTGDADFTGDLDVSAYILQAGNFTKIETRILVVNISAGTSVPISYTITGLPAGIDPANVMQIRINESDDNFLVPECNYAGNFSKALFGAPDYGLCPGNHTLYFYPGNSGYLYVWYDSDPTKLPKPASVGSGDSYDFTQSATQLTKKLFVEVYDGPSLMDVYSVITYLIPDSLTWTGATSSDWNDYRNWNYSNNPQPAITAYDTIKYQIPGECTNVLIATSAPAYPNLNSFSTDFRANVVCDKIYFAFGGEVARTDTLNYAEAYVDLTLNTHQYYMIAPSLKNMYTGDYYITQPNPWLDDRLYEPMFFNVPNPQTLKTAITTWTGRFNNPDILLNAGQGMAIWYNKLDQGYTYHNSVTTHFPKHDHYYRYYSVETQAPTLWSNYMDRTDNHRFIYEPLATTGLVPLSLGNQIVTAGGTPVLIGNPFMAHLNLDPFLTANNTEIYAGYKLASGVASVDGKMNNFVSYQRVGETWFTTDPNLSGTVNNLTVAPTIAPMQSFIVIAKKANPQIKAPVTTMTTTPGNVLRSAAKNEIKVLSIVAQKEDELDKALLIGAGNSVFNAEEDSYKFFPNNNDKALLVYTRSNDGYALDINSFGNYNEVITLGIKTSQTGQITLKFSGAESFADDATLYLNDTKESRTINLSLQEEYAFTKTADEDLYLENRFFLNWVPNAPTDLKNVEQDGIVIQSSGRNIEIISKNGSPLNNVRIDDTQGRAIVNKSHYEASSYHFEAPAAGVYLVKVQSQVKKVVVR